MIWRLVSPSGRTVATGTRSAVLDAAEERRVLVVETLGRETCEPVHLPRFVVAGWRIVPEVTAGAMRRAA